MPDMRIILSNQLSNVAAQTTLDLNGVITSMKASGMSNSAIKQTLLNDLNTGGRIFGGYKNQIKNTVKSGVGMAGNNGSQGRFKDAGVQQFKWVTVSNNVCPDCEERHNETGTMEYFETIGLPKSGFSVCQQHCQCQLLPVDYKGENLDKPLVREKKVSITSPIKKPPAGWGYYDKSIKAINQSNFYKAENIKSNVKDFLGAKKTIKGDYSYVSVNKKIAKKYNDDYSGTGIKEYKINWDNIKKDNGIIELPSGGLSKKEYLHIRTGEIGEINTMGWFVVGGKYIKANIVGIYGGDVLGFVIKRKYLK